MRPTFREPVGRNGDTCQHDSVDTQRKPQISLLIPSSHQLGFVTFRRWTQKKPFLIDNDSNRNLKERIARSHIAESKAERIDRICI